jgi:hypothetical protein
VCARHCSIATRRRSSPPLAALSYSSAADRQLSRSSLARSRSLVDCRHKVCDRRRYQAVQFASGESYALVDMMFCCLLCRREIAVLLTRRTPPTQIAAGQSQEQHSHQRKWFAFAPARRNNLVHSSCIHTHVCVARIRSEKSGASRLSRQPERRHYKCQPVCRCASHLVSRFSLSLSLLSCPLSPLLVFLRFLVHSNIDRLFLEIVSIVVGGGGGFGGLIKHFGEEKIRRPTKLLFFLLLLAAPARGPARGPAAARNVSRSKQLILFGCYVAADYCIVDAEVFCFFFFFFLLDRLA